METFSSASDPWGIFDRLTRAQFAEFQQAGISFLSAQLLFNRGLHTSEAMSAFLAARLDQIPDPFLLIDMERAVARILLALNQREHITVYGDFDADGVTSAALVTRALRYLGQPGELLSFYLPSRLQGIRGLDRDALDLVRRRGTSLIITTDCGSSDREEVAYAQSLGIDVIITDHHHPPAQLPQALALINPWRPDSLYGERYLCGVGIAFKLAQALYQARGCPQEDLWQLLDLVAIGTIGDVASLLGENHTLVRAGMHKLNHSENVGLQALMQITRLQAGKIRERDISYVLAPRINAAGRMKDADLAFLLLTTTSVEEAKRLAAELEELNISRQQQTEDLMKLVREQAQGQTDKQVILVYGEKEHWPEGIIGLVAGKLVEELGRPVFVLSQDTKVSRGSARSQENFNLILALQAARPDLFERYGGHAQAAGFTIPNEHISELHDHLLRWYQQSQSAGSSEISVEESETLNSIGIEAEPVAISTNRKIDLVITKPELLNMDTLEKINQLGPFGSGNPEAVFLVDGLRLVKRWPSGFDGRHLRVRLRSNHLTFNGRLLRGGKQTETLQEGVTVQVIFSLEQAQGSSEREVRPEVWLKILEIKHKPPISDAANGDA